MVQQEEDPTIEVEIPDEGSPLEARAEAGQQQEEGVPGWARPYIPADVKIPPGREVLFLRFKSKWTDAPGKGVETDWPVILNGKVVEGRMQPFLTRVLVCWTLSDAEERFAYKRSRGDVGRPVEELALQMIRAVDGQILDWTGTWAKKDRVEDLVNPQRVWTELGSKCRMQVKNAYAKMHVLSGEEMADFFLNGFSTATAAAG